MTKSGNGLSRREIIASAAIAPFCRSGGMRRADPPPSESREASTIRQKIRPGRVDGYVDIHVHLGQPWNERGELTATMLLQYMDEHRVEQAVVLPLISPESWFYPITTEWVLKETKPFRDRLIPFCAVDPRTAVMGGERPFHDILRRYRDAGAMGFGEHKWGGPMDDPRNIELIRACGEIGLPILFHIDNDRNTDRPGLPGLARVLAAAPEAALIGHGPGFWASISGEVNQGDLHGYPRGKVLPGGALDQLLKDFPNLHCDLSAGSGHNALNRDLEFARQFLTRHADRIMFGTDYLADKQVVEQFGLFETLDLPLEIEEKVFRGNARRLLKLT